MKDIGDQSVLGSNGSVLNMCRDDDDDDGKMLEIRHFDINKVVFTCQC